MPDFLFESKHLIHAKEEAVASIYNKELFFSPAPHNNQRWLIPGNESFLDGWLTERKILSDTPQ